MTQPTFEFEQSQDGRKKDEKKNNKDKKVNDEKKDKGANKKNKDKKTVTIDRIIRVESQEKGDKNKSPGETKKENEEIKDDSGFKKGMKKNKRNKKKQQKAIKKKLAAQLYKPESYDPCVHLHFKPNHIDRDCLTQDQYFEMLATPKGYRWAGEVDCNNPELEINKHKKKKAKRRKLHYIQAEAGDGEEQVETIWDVITPEITGHLLDFLQNEFGMSHEEAEDFISSVQQTCTVKQPKPKKKKMKEKASKYKWAKDYSQIFSKNIEQYLNVTLTKKRTPRVRKIAEVIIEHICDLTGENISMDRPKKKSHKLILHIVDRLALWIDDVYKPERKKKVEEEIPESEIEEEEEEDKKEEEKKKEEKPKDKKPKEEGEGEEDEGEEEEEEKKPEKQEDEEEKEPEPEKEKKKEPQEEKKEEKKEKKESEKEPTKEQEPEKEEEKETEKEKPQEKEKEPEKDKEKQETKEEKEEEKEVAKEEAKEDTSKEDEPVKEEKGEEKEEGGEGEEEGPQVEGEEEEEEEGVEEGEEEGDEGEGDAEIEGIEEGEAEVPAHEIREEKEEEVKPKTPEEKRRIIPQRKSPGYAFEVKPKTGSTLQVQKLSSGTVAEVTAEVRGVEAPPRRRKIPVSESPFNLKSAEDWAEWAENIGNMAEEWGKWLDSRLTEAEKQVVEKTRSTDDWKAWRNQAQRDALKWRVEEEKIKDEAEMWSKKIEDKLKKSETEINTTDFS